MGWHAVKSNQPTLVRWKKASESRDPFICWLDHTLQAQVETALGFIPSTQLKDQLLFHIPKLHVIVLYKH